MVSVNSAAALCSSSRADSGLIDSRAAFFPFSVQDVFIHLLVPNRIFLFQKGGGRTGGGKLIEPLALPADLPTL